MFNVIFKKKNDQRILLLDYTKNDAPMLKEFPCESNEDIFYNFFDNQLNYFRHEFIEL